MAWIYVHRIRMVSDMDSECQECGETFRQPRKDRVRVYCGLICRQAGNSKKSKGVSGNRGRHLFKTGRIITEDGYVRALARDHPFPRSYHYIFEHVMVMERHIGRRLKSNECVHHVNMDRKDNRLCNLRLMTKSGHSKLHRAMEKKVRNA